jgi:uncharacterized protein YabE (DUF348 family)
LATRSITVHGLTWTLPGWLQGLLVLGLIAGAVALLTLGLAQTGQPLVVEVDGQRHEARTHAMTVGQALRRGGFDLHPEDRVSPTLDMELQPGMVIRVQRARPVELHMDGRTRRLRTHATAVDQLLAEAGVQLGPADEIWLDERLVEPEALLWGDETDAPRTPSYRGGPRVPTDAGTGDPPVIVVRRALSLSLNDDGASTTLYTTSDTVGQVLEEHGVLLYLGDEVQPGLQDRVKPGMTVTIDRSVPIQIEADGRTIHTRTRAEDVAGALGQEGIALLGKDRVEPALSTPIRSGGTLHVIRVREEFAIEFESIPFHTEWVPDPEVEIDSIRLVREGQVGLTKRRFRIVYENDQEIDRYLEDVWAAQPPITKTMAYGTKIIIRTLETPDGEIEYWRKMRVYTTSYTAATCGKPRDHPRYGYTRLGIWLTKGIVAIDPMVIPLKTRLYVPGYGLAFAGDTGGGVKGKFVDLGFDEHNYESWHWWTDVYILTPVPTRDKIRWILPDMPKFPDRGRR